MDGDDDAGSTEVDGEGDKDDSDSAAMASETIGVTDDNADDEMELLDEAITDSECEREAVEKELVTLMGDDTDNDNTPTTNIEAETSEDTEEPSEEQSEGRERVIHPDAETRNVYNLWKWGGKPDYQYW